MRQRRIDRPSREGLTGKIAGIQFDDLAARYDHTTAELFREDFSGQATVLARQYREQGFSDDRLSALIRDPAHGRDVEEIADRLAALGESPIEEGGVGD